MAVVTELWRRIPAADRLLGELAASPAGVGLRHEIALAIVQEFQNKLRREIASGERSQEDLTPDVVRSELYTFAATRIGGSLRRVINATGIILHTNLGRAVLAPEVLAEMTELAGGALNIECDIETGKRGHRQRARRQTAQEPGERFLVASPGQQGLTAIKAIRCPEGPGID